MKYLELTIKSNGVKTLINMDQAFEIQPLEEGGCAIKFCFIMPATTGGFTIAQQIVVESRDQILKYLK